MASWITVLAMLLMAKRSKELYETFKNNLDNMYGQSRVERDEGLWSEDR